MVKLGIAPQVARNASQETEGGFSFSEWLGTLSPKLQMLQERDEHGNSLIDKAMEFKCFSSIVAQVERPAALDVILR